MSNFRLASNEAEIGLLGACLIDRNAASEIFSKVVAEEFEHGRHKRIYEAMRGLVEPDAVLLKEALGPEFPKLGGTEYIMSLMHAVPSAANVCEYIEIVKNAALRRRVSKICQDFSQNHEKLGGQELLAELQREIFSISPEQSSVSDMHKLLEESALFIDEAGQGLRRGLSFGFVDLDSMIPRGLQPADLVIIAGRPSMGKTSFAVNLASHCIFDEGVPVMFFSLEVQKVMVMLSFLCSRIEVDLGRIMKGDLSKEEYRRISQEQTVMDAGKLFIDDGKATIEQICSTTRLYARKEGVKVIFIDYLQLLDVQKHETRQEDISYISRQLKGLARELGITVVALSQLNRNPENREDKRPHLADLRESGALEQDADLILFLYRDEYYNQNTDQQGIAEVIIAKQRFGPTGTAKLAFKKQFARFESLVSHFERV